MAKLYKSTMQNMYNVPCPMTCGDARWLRNVADRDGEIVGFISAWLLLAANCLGARRKNGE
jgi:hypothetical protein